MTRMTVGSRGSELALAQTQIVVDRLERTFPHIQVALVKMLTHGDRNQSLTIDFAEQDGIFVREMEEALLDRRIDMAIHSLKDVPTQIPEGLALAAVLEREDPRDVMVTRGQKLDELPAGARIGTSSLRRAIQLARIRPDIETCGIRGNVDTRLRKVASGEYDGVILAAAGLLRLGWRDRISEYFSLEQFLPAVGQAALVIETRSDDAGVRSVAGTVNHLPTWHSITAERAFLMEVGGGCTAPIAALAVATDGHLRLDGMVASPTSHRVVRSTEEGDAESADVVGRRLARRLLAMGAAEFIAEANSL